MSGATNGIAGHAAPAPARKARKTETEEENIFEGLPLLQRDAVVGAARIREIAARPIVWLWRDLVTDGQVVILFGAPGGGKTTLMFLLVVARASHVALEVLGRAVEPAPAGKYVVLIEGEHGESSAARKLTKTTSVLGTDAHERDPLDRIIMLARKEVRVGSEKWDEVKALIADGYVSDLFVDSLARFAAGGDSNAERDQVEVFAEVGEAIEGAPSDTKPTCWMIAHGRKDSDGSIDDVSGNTQRAAQADSILFVKASRDDDDKVTSSRVTATKLREEPDEWPTAVDFAIAKDERGRWSCIVGGAATPAGKQAPHERVYAFLAAATEPKSKNAIRDVLGMSGTSIENAITKLFSDKRIGKKGEGKKAVFFAVKKPRYEFRSANRRKEKAA